MPTKVTTFEGVRFSTRSHEEEGFWPEGADKWVELRHLLPVEALPSQTPDCEGCGPKGTFVIVTTFVADKDQG